MSLAVMTNVWKDAPYSGGELLVLLALADWSDDQGNCWVKVPMLAKKARISERTAQYALRRFMEENILTIVQENRGSQPRALRISEKFTGFESSTGRGAKSAPLDGVGVQSTTAEMLQIAPPYKEKQRLKSNIRTKQGGEKPPSPRFSQVDFDERDLRKIGAAKARLNQEIRSRPSSSRMTVREYYTQVAEESGVTIKRIVELEKLQKEWPVQEGEIA